MNAPMPAASFAQMLSLEVIAPSKTNPRKRFDKVALDELTESVRARGVIQPILVRPLDAELGAYELVAGERRWRAAKAAGLAEIPAVVRTLSEAEALELQVIENLQRTDLHPLEEAEGYEQLMKLHAYTVDQLAEKVGKSKAYVYARIKLTALCKEARDAFYDGKLTPSTALLVARIPVHKVQVAALKRIIEPDYRGDVMSFRLAAEQIRREFMLRLKDATFDIKDGSLVPKAGACADCPKRTGNQPELFSDVEDVDVCTDPHCFAQKRDADFKRQREKAEAAGRKVITGPEAKKVAPYGEYSLKGYRRSDDEIRAGDKYQKAGTLAKKLNVETALLEVPGKNTLMEVVPDGALQAALKKAGLIDRSSREPSAPKTSRAKRSPEEIDEDRCYDEICDAIRAAIRNASAELFSAADFVAIAAALTTHTPEEISDAWGFKSKAGQYTDKFAADLNAWLATLSSQDLARYMLDCVIATASYDDESMLLAAAKRRNIDVEAIKRETIAAVKAKEAAKQTERGPSRRRKRGAGKP